MQTGFDSRTLTICPGEGRFTRGAGRVRGTAKGERNTMEWQWAQGAMFGYFYPDFKARHPHSSFVLAEAEYALLATGITAGDAMLKRLTAEFRRDHARGGALRPDILGFCARPPVGGRMVLELLEVSTADQAVATLRDDIGYKTGKLQQIIRGLSPSLGEAFSLTSYSVDAGPSKWRPLPLFQRVVPLPLAVDEKGTTYVEWICFQPTFNRNWPDGVDGLLLYEIHRMPLKSEPVAVAKLVGEEQRRRQASRTAYGLTLTPWLDEQYLSRVPIDRDDLRRLVTGVGIGALILLAVYLAPVVAGAEVAALVGAGTAETAGGAAVEVSAAQVVTAGTGLTATMETAGQWVAALGRQFALNPAPAP